MASRGRRGRGGDDAGVRLLDLALPLGAQPLLLRGVELHERSLVVAIGIGGLIQDRVKLEVFVERERVVLVRVALGARHGGAHPDGEGRVDAIDDGDGAEFLIVRAALGIVHRVPMEAGGVQLIGGRVGQKIAGHLLDRELVERHVAVERIDHVIAVAPDRPRLIVGIPPGIGVAREVQP
jgi:hypothetical protein